jgi:hypothetical protein
MSSSSKTRITKQLSSLQPYMTKRIDKKGLNLNISIIPNQTVLYQGTDFDFNKYKISVNESKTKASSLGSHKSSIDNIESIDDIISNAYYNYYDARHNGSYFLSSQKTANIYGIDKDYSTIIYSTIPDLKEINSPNNQIKYIYPLYYIAKRGFTIKYETTKDLFLIDIGNLHNIQKLFDIIDLLDVNKRIKDDYKYYLHTTCAFRDDDDYDFDNKPTSINRNSDATGDDILVELFKSVSKFLYENRIANIDGWIHYKTDKFHDEILIITNEALKIKKISTRRLPIVTHGIPSYNKYMKINENKKIKYLQKNKRNNILHNYIIPDVKK